MLSLKKRLPALVLLAALVFTGCNYFDLGEPMPEGQQTQPAGGVLTVKGVKNGTHHEAAVYDYPDDDVADAADLKDLMSRFELVAVGLGTAGNKTLALGLVTLDGENFTADGDFLVVLKQVTKDDSAPLKYKGAVPFSGGNATVEYNKMETATRIYTVTFDLNYTDAPNPPKPQEIDADGKIAQPAAPTRTGGYTFGGWFLNAAGTGAAWDFGTDTVKKDITLYAKWTRNAYTVTFYLNYTGATNPPKPQEIDEGGKVTQPAAPTRTGYTLDGWFLDAAGTGAAWDFDKGTVTTNLDLYAKWTRNTYKVTFYTGDAEYTPAPLENVLYDDKITAPIITKAGHTLDGWYKEKGGAAKWDFALNTVKENITLYGTWTQIKYTVTFNTGAGGSIVSALEVPHGSAATRPTTNPTRADCDFDNWYAANADTPYNFNSTVTADITLYAKWKPRTFAAAIVCMAETANSTSANYTLPSGNETYTAAITPLTTANSPASVVIDGGGRIVTGSTNRFTIGSGVTITLKNITFKTLPLSVSTGGKLVLDNGAVVTENAEIGVTVSSGILEMNTGALVEKNSNSGICIEGTSAFTMSGGTISGNNARRGGGVQVNGGTFTMSGGTISGNQAGVNGGGVQINGGTFTMSSGEISGNNAPQGSGVFMLATTVFNMSGGYIKDNQVEWDGGGVRVQANSTFNMTGGEITGNVSHRPEYNSTGGVYLEGGGTITGNPRIGNPVTSGSGSGWIYGNSPTDKNW